jgi:hypothetical protein
MTSINLSILRGNFWSRYMSIKQNNNVPIDITGYTFQFIAKERKAILFDVDGSVKTSDALINSTNFTILDAASGEVTINLLLVDTNLDAGDYDYMLFMFDSEGNRNTVMEGVLTVRDTVS